MNETVTTIVSDSATITTLITAGFGLFGVLMGSLISIYQRFSEDIRLNNARSNFIDAEVDEAKKLLEGIILRYEERHKLSGNLEKQREIEDQIKKYIIFNDFKPVFLSNMMSYSNLDSTFVQKCFQFFHHYNYAIRLFTHIDSLSPKPEAFSKRDDWVTGKLNDYVKDANIILKTQNRYNTTFFQFFHQKK